MNVYESIPTMEKGEIRLRPVTAEDEAALLRVYGDPLALPFFNSDNCHGDIFYYDTPEKMRRAMDFWRTSWEQGWFVRWAIALRSEVIGTVELCRRGGVAGRPVQRHGHPARGCRQRVGEVGRAGGSDGRASARCVRAAKLPHADDESRAVCGCACGDADGMRIRAERQAGDGTPWGKVRVLLGQGKVRRIEKRGAQVGEDLCAACVWGNYSFVGNYSFATSALNSGIVSTKR